MQTLCYVWSTALPEINGSLFVPDRSSTVDDGKKNLNPAPGIIYGVGLQLVVGVIVKDHLILVVFVQMRRPQFADVYSTVEHWWTGCVLSFLNELQPHIRPNINNSLLLMRTFSRAFPDVEQLHPSLFSVCFRIAFGYRHHFSPAVTNLFSQ